jgi:microsomal dipeptidase-like Zn-dependent dipeptidase
MFFDLHTHPSLKSFLSNGKINSWGFVDSKIMSHGIDSECNFTQMKIGKVKIAVVAIHPLERQFCAPLLLKGLLPHFAPLDGKFLKAIQDGKISYYQMLNQELHQLEKDQHFDGSSFHFLNSIDDLSDDKTNVVLSIEGGHAFKSIHSEDHEEVCKDILTNFREFKKLPHRILFITLTHLAQANLCTHAFGMKMRLMFRDKRFYPKGSGITECGKEFIREALSNENGKRILIDIKHMSLRSRKEFYDLRKIEFPDAPILASHMGIAGCSIYKIPIHSVTFRRRLFNVMKERQRYKVKYYKLPGLLNTYFNPSSINLYDEEIIEIVESSGLIGISIDRRILGLGGTQKDFFSFEEFNNYYKEFIAENRLIKTSDEIDIKKEDEFDEEEEFGMLAKGLKDPYQQFKYVCNNIIHILKVAGEKAWDCICLGSDFDGIIDTLEPVPTIIHYQNLEKALNELLPIFMKEAKIPMVDVQVAVRKIMYDNGYEFLRRNFK